MKIIGIAAAALVLAGAATARAQGAPAADIDLAAAPARAPHRAFELSLDLGYAQGFGSLRDGRAVRDMAGAGAALGIGLGFRATPYFSIGAHGGFQGYDPSASLPSGTTVRGVTAGVETTFHVSPYERADPWLSLGTGYRMLWEVPEGTATSTLTHGFELGKLAIGLDVRPSNSVALAPLVAVGLDLFAWQKASGTDNVMLSGNGVSAFLFAGVRGRFDLGGSRVEALVPVRASATGSR